MQKIPLFKFTRKDGGTTVSPVKPKDIEYEEAVRLVADKGKMLTRDGVNFSLCVDVADADGWTETDVNETFLKGE